jgi:hypothetical protein
MTSDMTLLKDIQVARGGRITFGDGSQAKLIVNRQINIPGIEVSQKALYVEGLKANLLSISQLCDDDLVVQFSKKECNIFDSNEKWLMGGERTTDNCYGLSFYMTSLGRDHRVRTSPTPRSTSVPLLLCTDS